MPNDLRLRAATLVSLKTYPGTDQQFQNGLLAFCRARGIDTAGTNQQILDRVMDDLYDHVKRTAQEQLKREKAPEHMQEINDEVATEVPF